ncbi:hypothetical protein RB620_24625 [Paenibacillus sp. LHD-117]|uniref:hypothetical protein n=1 Tax=Paenibacillus sp. LHD-117 TaxID=3071412 RepID=UPI0027E02B7A|nr:hypothetical protein [Paenibacillus sp. LHD-117]MDQ6422622.1 hypothetical protein [Paenibacillus sp. LHD-117]
MRKGWKDDLEDSIVALKLQRNNMYDVLKHAASKKNARILQSPSECGYDDLINK